jgi:hypothetical protein
MNADQARLCEWAALNQEKRQLETRLTQIKARQEALTAPILEYFIEGRQQRTTVDGETLYLAKETWAKAAPGCQETLNAWLTAHGLADFIMPARANTNTLSAYVRELRREQRPIPSDLDPLIEVNDVVKLKGVAAANGQRQPIPEIWTVEEDVP